MKNLTTILDMQASAYLDISLKKLLRDACAGAPDAYNDDTPTRQGFCLSITTATVYAHDISGPITEKISHAIGISGDRRTDIQLALQEAIGNAALHGNLGLPSLCSTDMTAFEAYSDRLKTALNTNALTQKPLCIRAEWDDTHLALSVRDQGKGFDTTLVREMSIDGVCGRGIPLMQELSSQLIFEEQGRQSTMLFNR